MSAYAREQGCISIIAGLLSYYNYSHNNYHYRAKSVFNTIGCFNGCNKGRSNVLAIIDEYTNRHNRYE